MGSSHIFIYKGINYTLKYEKHESLPPPDEFSILRPAAHSKSSQQGYPIKQRVKAKSHENRSFDILFVVLCVSQQHRHHVSQYYTLDQIYVELSKLYHTLSNTPKIL